MHYKANIFMVERIKKLGGMLMLLQYILAIHNTKQTIFAHTGVC